MTMESADVMRALAARRRASGRLIIDLTQAFTRDELRVIFDEMPDDSTRSAGYRTLAGLVGTAWADYDNPGEAADTV